MGLNQSDFNCHGKNFEFYSDLGKQPKEIVEQKSDNGGDVKVNVLNNDLLNAGFRKRSYLLANLNEHHLQLSD